VQFGQRDDNTIDIRVRTVAKKAQYALWKRMAKIGRPSLLVWSL